MRRTLAAAFAATLLLQPAARAAADDPTPEAILDKAIEALGGAEALAKAEILSWKGEGVVSLGGSDNDFKIEMTTRGVESYRSKFEGDFNGNSVEVVVVVTPEHGWISYMGMVNDMDADALTNARRNVMLQVVSMNPTYLKGDGYELKAADAVKVDGKDAPGVEVKPKDGDPFTLYFDPETGLPARLVAEVAGFGGEEFDQQIDYLSYKEFDGIKHSVKSEVKRDGDFFQESEITEFHVLDKVEPSTFEKPK